MKLFVKPVVKASERFFVSRSAVEGETVLNDLGVALVGDDVVVSSGGMLPDGQVAEFLLGVSVSGGVERVLNVSRSVGADAWNAAVALEVQRELRRKADVFVLHGVVSRVAGVESVTVWSAEVHVLPEKVAAFEVASVKSPVKFAARVQALAELAWSRACEVSGVACGLPVVVPVAAARGEVVVDASPLSAEEELMLMVPDDWVEDGAGV